MQTFEQLELLAKTMFTLHFSTDDYTAVSCRDCVDYKTKQCAGRGFSGIKCLHCMAVHLVESHGVVLH